MTLSGRLLPPAPVATCYSSEPNCKSRPHSAAKGHRTARSPNWTRCSGPRAGARYLRRQWPAAVGGRPFKIPRDGVVAVTDLSDSLELAIGSMVLSAIIITFDSTRPPQSARICSKRSLANTDDLPANLVAFVKSHYFCLNPELVSLA
jgi:hypothetical protein